MDSNRTLTAKILVGTRGLGVPDPDLLQQRAWELAAIQEHDFPNSADWDEARRELHGRGAIAVTPHSNASAAAGEFSSYAPYAPYVKSAQREDEPTLGEELIREGMEEAEHERMLLARRPKEE